MVLSSHRSLASAIAEDPISEMRKLPRVRRIEIICPLSPSGRISSQLKSKHKFYLWSQSHLPPAPGWVSQGCGEEGGRFLPLQMP